jgi:hypothetical protein
MPVLNYDRIEVYERKTGKAVDRGTYEIYFGGVGGN